MPRHVGCCGEGGGIPPPAGAGAVDLLLKGGGDHLLEKAETTAAKCRLRMGARTSPGRRLVLLLGNSVRIVLVAGLLVILAGIVIVVGGFRSRGRPFGEGRAFRLLRHFGLRPG